MKFGFEPLAGRTGHDAGRQLLQKLYEKPLPPILLTPRGKPYFENSPVHFSISHSDSAAFCVLSDCPVGIDAEHIDRPIKLALADKILSPAERQYFDAAQDQRLTLLKFWVLKEALAKATGEGLRGYPNHTNFTPDDPRLFVRDNHLVAIIEMR